MRNVDAHYHGDEIAIIGMSGRFPGASDIDAFWRNLCAGVESIASLSDQELLDAGVDPLLLSNPQYVRASAFLEDIEWFDAALFGFNPREAEIMDPQQRLFLECAWEALEHAGYDPQIYRGRIGVYASVSTNSYLFNLYSNPELVRLVSHFQIGLGNNKDHLTTRVSYKLNLRGPSVNVQTACSSSLVATHLACQSLLNGECEIALAGGVCINLPQKRGYIYQEGGIDSPDGHCRAFDAAAQGTVGGNGVGIVVLKRLADALADRDCIHALIKGSAINNDGSSKAGYTAPSIPAQAEVIAAALAVARVSPETIGYVEAHGTATPLGDPIEIAALTKVFRASTQRSGFCAIGAVKTNIGHLDAAAGVAGLIKTALTLKHGLIPPSLHYEQPNPRIDFASSPFSVNTTLTEWKTDDTPRRAGISSFGIGGTNAHVILEAPPVVEAGGASRPWQVLALSARTGSALDAATAKLAAHLRCHPDLNLADVAYTLQIGRQSFTHRRALVCRDRADALNALEHLDPARIWTSYYERGRRPVVFLFPGQGAQYPRMAAPLYQAEPVFREQVDRCAELLISQLGLDLRTILYPNDSRMEDGGWRMEDRSSILHPPSSILDLEQTQYTQPALFVVEYALARLWMSWGVRPQAMIGHSIGEYVAACLAGVFSLEDALALVAARGRLMQQLPGGAMLAVTLAEEELLPLLGSQLSVAAVNAPGLCAISGCADAIAALERQLTEQGVVTRRLHTSHAFHSAMMDPILEPFTELVRRIPLKPPTIPYVSNLTGTWMTATAATDPGYWARHLRSSVRFDEGVRELMREPERVLLEVGPGQTLTTLLRQHPDTASGPIVIASLRHPQDQRSDQMLMLSALGQLWSAGVEVDWARFSADERRRRMPLPTYPFERQRYWIEPRRQTTAIATSQAALSKKTDSADWFYVPAWRRSITPMFREPAQACDSSRRWLVFGDAHGVGAQIARRLARNDQDVIVAMAGERFSRRDDGVYTINPRRREDYSALVTQLRALGKAPDVIAHLWSVTRDDQKRSPNAQFEIAQNLGFYSLLFLAQALEEQRVRNSIDIVVISNNAQDVSGEERIRPEKATMLGPCRVVPQEYTHITCRSVDIVLPDESGSQEALLLDQLIAELTATTSDLTVAYRGRQRWVQCFEAVRLAETPAAAGRLREGGVYLITGGLGGIGLALAEHLARTVRAKLVLVGRSSFPERSTWSDWLTTHDDADAVSRKIRMLQAFESHGAQVMVVQADVADRAHMHNVIREAGERLGAINGVFHTAGWTGQASMGAIQEISREQCEQHFRSKAHGLLVLESVLQDQRLDFYLLFSSLASLLGGLGFVAYSAANSYMDAFAHCRSRTSATPWISVNWDGWQLREPQAGQPGFGASLAELALTPDEGIESVRRLLSIEGAAQVAVSTGDLAARIDRWVRRAATRAVEPAQQDGSFRFHTRPQLRDSYMAPRDEIERTVAGVWQAVLGIEAVGVHDNFFELGGHSLLATQMISRLRDALRIELPLRSLFETSTVAGLAEYIATIQGTRPTLPIPLVSVARDRPPPLSFAQQRLWFLDQLEPNSATYNVPTVVHLGGSLDIAAFGHSLNEIVRRHEVLRTTFAVVDRQPVQVIGPACAIRLPLIDLQNLPAAEREAVARRLAQAELQQPFDLAHGPLIRTSFLRLAPDDHVLLLTAHHIVCDGWSMGIFVQELAALYAAAVAGRLAALPALPIQYADYAVWQRAWLQGSALETQSVYWQRQLADLPVLQIPTDRPRPKLATSRGACHTFLLPGELSSQLVALSRKEGVTLFMTLLAAFLIVLHYYTHSDDLVVGTDVANRTRGEIEGLIGFFVNQLVLRTDLSGNPTFRALLGRVRDVVLEASAHQDLPFDKLVEILNPVRDPSRHPLFQVKVVFQNAPSLSAESAGLIVNALEIEQQTARFDISLLINDTAQGVHGTFEYNTDLFDAATMVLMYEHFATMLRNGVTQPEANLDRLEALLAQVDRRERSSSGQKLEATILQKLKNVRRKAIPIAEGQGDAS